jgi:exodeoxyribonuclease VII small subunit
MATATAKKKKDPADPESPTFEDALASLEGIIRQLERDDLTLDGALSRFEDGVRLMRFCDAHLKSAKGRLMELAQGGGGELITEILGEGLESFTGGSAEAGSGDDGGG